MKRLREFLTERLTDQDRKDLGSLISTTGNTRQRKNKIIEILAIDERQRAFYFPLNPTLFKRLLGADAPQTMTAFHVTDWEGLHNLKMLANSAKTVSCFTRAESVKNMMDYGIETKGGVLVKVQGVPAFASVSQDAHTVLDEHGGRWVPLFYLFKGVENRSLREQISTRIYNKRGDLVRKYAAGLKEATDISDLRFDSNNDDAFVQLLKHLDETNDMKTLGKLMKEYIDFLQQILRENTRHIYSPLAHKIGPPEAYGYNEVLLSRVKVLNIALNMPKVVEDLKADAPDAFHWTTGQQKYWDSIQIKAGAEFEKEVLDKLHKAFPGVPVSTNPEELWTSSWSD